MISLHYFNEIRYFYFYLLVMVNYLTPVFINFIFSVFLIFILIFNNFYTTYKRFFKKTILTLYWLMINFFLIFFLLKFIGTFYVINKSSAIFLADFTSNENTSLNITGDTIILLCIIITILSWILLSERYLNNSSVNVFYFTVFTVLTVNMVYTKNILIMFIFFEFIFLPSLFFVYTLGYSKKVEKTIKYLLIWTFLGSFIVLSAIVYVFSTTQSLNLDFIRLFKFSFLEKTIIGFLFFIGFGVKIPIWPFHYWLTKVHVEAPTGFSIFLSGFLVKTALYCFIVCYSIFKSQFMTYLLLTWVLWGSLDASIRMWSSTDIKRLIAFATIQEMNLILSFFLILPNTSYMFVNVFLIMHGVLSGLMFFLVDQVQKRYQTRNLMGLGGLSTKNTLLTVCIWFMILIFRGFPIFVKFLIEWELLILLFENFSIIGVLIFLFITIFGVLGFCRVWFIVLYGQPTNSNIRSVDLLKNDLIIASIFIITLLFLNFFILFF